jgi:hypothetical protein
MYMARNDLEFMNRRDVSSRVEAIGCRAPAPAPLTARGIPSAGLTALVPFRNFPILFPAGRRVSRRWPRKTAFSPEEP